MSSDAIVIQDLKKSFKTLKVLDGISLTVQRGSVVALLGPNGAGKTTTVRILSTLIRPDSGTALVNGYNVATQGNEVRASIGLTGQYAAVDGYLTGRENLEMIGRLYRLDRTGVKRRAQELLERFDLVDAADRPVKTYSGGMRRRIDLAMSLVSSPPVIFLDEPTTGLDPRSRLTMWDIIKELAATKVTVLLTTQYMEEADRLADKIVVIDRGAVIAEGTANELKAKTGSDRLELTLANAHDLAEARRHIGGDSQHVDDKRRMISIATTAGMKHLREILHKLEEAHIEVESLSLHRPTLDDVFLSLTGHTSSEGETESSASGEQKK